MVDRSGGHPENRKDKIDKGGIIRWAINEKRLATKVQGAYFYPENDPDRYPFVGPTLLFSDFHPISHAGLGRFFTDRDNPAAGGT